MAEFRLDVEFSKRAVDNDRRLVGGYAYVSKRNGETLFDSQGDSIDPEDLRESAHEFMKTDRAMGVMHLRSPDGKVIRGGEVVELAVLAGDFRPPGMSDDREGLWLVCKVADDAAWLMIKSGDFRGFSIGGRGVREPVE